MVTDEEPQTWEEATANETPEQKLLRAVRWSAGLAHQGEDAGSGWDRAMQEVLPIAEELLK